MGKRTEPINDEEFRLAVADALDVAPLRFQLTEGHIVHIERAEREARRRRISRQSRVANP